MIRRILVPLDGSARATGVLPHVGVVAAALDSRLDLMQAIPGGGLGLDDPLAFRLARADRLKALEEIAAELRETGLKVGTLVEPGDPPEAILGVLRREPYDLVALSSHGEGRQTDVPLGCTAIAVALSSPTSLLIGPAEGGCLDDDNPVEGPVMALVDCSPIGDCSVNIAARVAARSGRSIALVHVLDARTNRYPSGGLSGGPVPASGRTTGEKAADARRYLNSTAERLERRGLRVEDRLVETTENPIDALCEAIESQAPMLVVLCAHGSGTSAKWPLGGTAAKLIFCACAPVLVLRLDSPDRSSPFLRAPSSWGESREAASTVPA